MELEFYGRIPSKKNSRVNTRSGKSFPSPEYEKWHKACQLQQLKAKYPKIETPTGLKVTIYFPDNRRADLTNKAESIMDFLVDMKLIPDDNHTVINPLILCGEVRKGEGGFKIETITKGE